MWLLWLWLLKSTGNERSDLEMAQNLALDASAGCIRSRRLTGALTSPGPGEGGPGIR